MQNMHVRSYYMHKFFIVRPCETCRAFVSTGTAGAPMRFRVRSAQARTDQHLRWHRTAKNTREKYDFYDKSQSKKEKE